MGGVGPPEGLRTCRLPSSSPRGCGCWPVVFQWGTAVFRLPVLIVGGGGLSAGGALHTCDSFSSGGAAEGGTAAGGEGVCEGLVVALEQLLLETHTELWGLGICKLASIRKNVLVEAGHSRPRCQRAGLACSLPSSTWGQSSGPSSSFLTGSLGVLPRNTGRWSQSTQVLPSSPKGVRG